MWSGQDLTRRSPLLSGAEAARRQVTTAGLPKKRNRAPIYGGGDCVDTICADLCSMPASCRGVFLGRYTVVISGVVAPYGVVAVEISNYNLG